jgi:osmotically-inducible protein OsmY
MPKKLQAVVVALVALCIAGGCRSRVASDLSVPDPTITASVKSALATDTTANFKEVSVETRDGTVTLTGVVELWAERTRAEALTLKIRGVKAVINRLEVAPPKRPR